MKKQCMNRMNPVVIVAMIAILFFAPHAGAQNWVWAKTSLGNLYTPVDVTSDPSGNSYTLGQFQGSMMIDNNTYTSNGFSDIYLIKRDMAGNVLWVRTIGGPNNEFAGRIEANNQNELYFYMTIPWGSDTIIIGNDTISVVSSGCILFKFNAAGNYIWSVFNSGQVFANDLALSTQGDIILAGRMSGQVSIGNQQFNNNASSAFVARFTASGNTNWVRKFTGLTTGSTSNVDGVSLDNQGNSYLAGNFSGTILFGNNIVLFSSGNQANGFLAKLLPNGVVNWVNQLQGGGNFDSSRVAVSTDGSPILVGHLDGYAWFDDSTIIWSVTQSYDIFIAKYLDNGDLAWVRLAGGMSYDAANEIEVDLSGRVYISGYFTDSAQFSNLMVYANTGKDGFVAKYNNNGQVLWVKTVSGNGKEHCSGLSARNFNGIYVSGSNSFNNQVIFDTIIINNTQGAFTALLMDDCPNDSLFLNVQGPQMICHGDSLYMEANAGYVHYWWSTGETTQGIYASETGSYSCIAEDSIGCMLTSPTIDLVSVNNYFIPELCMVTVDSTSSKNIIVWEKPQVNFLDSFRIYREISNQYYHIGSVPYDSISQFTDTTEGVNPQITSYRYKVSSVDNCGNESALSDFHETIHLTTNLGTNGEVNLVWDDYIGFGFNVYKIYRDSTGQGNFELIDSVGFSNFTYTDLNPPAGAVTYMIEVIPPQVCVANRAVNYHSSRSNMPPTMQTGFDEHSLGDNGFLIFPNPARTHIALIADIQPGQLSALTLYNTSGQLLRTLHPERFPFEEDISQLPAGVYHLRLITRQGVFNRKLVKY